MSWGAIVTDARSGVVVEPDAVLGDLKMSDDLNEGGTLSGMLKTADVYGSLKAMRRVVWPTKDGVPFSPYLITELPRHDVSARYRPIEAVRADVALLKRRRFRHTLNFNQVDQFDIHREIIRYATNVLTRYTNTPQRKGDPFCGLPWFEMDDEPLSGVLRTRLNTPDSPEEGYPSQKRGVIWDALVNLRNLQNGFEYRLRPYFLPGVGPRCEMQLGYPTVGTLASDPQVGFEYPGNMSAPTYGEDGTDFYTLTDYLGEENNGLRPIGSAIDWPSLQQQGYPQLEGAWSESTVSEQGTLASKAMGRLYRTVPSAWGITLDGRRPPSFGQFGLGDHAVLRIRTRPGAPLIEQTVRITGWDLTVSGRQETLVPVLQVPV